MIHALPVARALRQALPEAELTWIVEAREHAILRDHPDLDGVLPVDTRRWRRLLRRPAGVRAVWREVAAVRRRLRAGRFDVAIDLQGLIKSGALDRGDARAAPDRVRRHPLPRAAQRAASPTGGSRRRRAPRTWSTSICPCCRRSASRRGRPQFHVPVRPVADRRMEELLVEHGVKRSDRLVAINPGAGRADKRWPIARLTAVAERLATEAGARILLLWGPDEAHLAREIRDGLSARAMLAPPTDLDELAGLLRRAALVVANDTGPLHLAAALGTPCLGLYGPTRSSRNGPYGRALSRAAESRRHDGRARAGARCSRRRSRCSTRVGSRVTRLTVTIIAWNEEERLRACLESVAWADEIVVIDAESTDKTAALAREFTDRVWVRPWPGFAVQKNFAIEQATGEWILSLDADERVTPELACRIQEIVAAGGPAAGYSVPRKNLFWGAWVRHGGLYPDYQLRLFRRGAGRFAEDAVHESVTVDGRVETLAEALLHQSYRDLEDFVRRSNRYSTLAARDWIRRGRRVSVPALVMKPLARFFSMYIVKRGFLDGWRGLVLAVLYAEYVFLRMAKAWEARRAPGPHGGL